MSSFFEKLKKGMRIENNIEKAAEKTEETEDLSKSLAKDKPKPLLKKKMVKKINKFDSGGFAAKINKFDSMASATKIKIESDSAQDLIEPEIKGPEEEELKKPDWPKPEEKKEIKLETKKPFFQKIAQKEEAEKVESNRQGFSLQNLGSEEGQLAIDVYQTNSELVIQSTIAGVKPEDLDISIEADTVLIKGNRQEPTESGEKNYFYQECYWGPFSRQIIMPEETDPSRAEATMKEGVLTIRIPKIERKKKRKIAVKT